MAINATVIIPVRNEEKFIKKTIDSLIQNNNTSNIEFIIIDGLSSDKTYNIVKKISEVHENIHLITNKYKSTPYALNLAINQSRGKYIIRADSHSVYPKKYLDELIEFMDKNQDIDNVGGICKTIPFDSSLMSKAIALCLSSKIGVGNSRFRVKNSLNPELVDTVPFGCFRRTLFEKIGLFDTSLERNQDDEFNLRIIKNNGKIMLLPNIIVKIFARENLKKLSRMMFGYGLFKPLVLKKIGHIFSFRQFAPFLLLFTTLASFILSYKFGLISFIILFLYLFIILIGSVNVAFNNKNYYLFPFVFVTFVVIHYSYGFGFLSGILNFWILNKKTKNIIISR